MAKKFFDSVKSMFLVTEGENSSNETVSTPVTVSPQPFILNTTSQTVSSSNESTEITQPLFNQKLMDKLCERLEQSKQGKIDYLDLKANTMDELIVESVPDEQKRFCIAFRMLQGINPAITKQSILDSVDFHIRNLKVWEKEAIDDVNNRRNANDEKRKEITAIEDEINRLTIKKGELQSEINETEMKCRQNETDMTQTVNLLVSSMNDDKEKINRMLN